MGKRSSFERIPQDFYPTPYAAVPPLIPHLRGVRTFAEPCCGDGALVRHLEIASGYAASMRATSHRPGCAGARPIRRAARRQKQRHNDRGAGCRPRSRAVPPDPPQEETNEEGMWIVRSHSAIVGWVERASSGRRADRTTLTKGETNNRTQQERERDRRDHRRERDGRALLHGLPACCLATHCPETAGRRGGRY